MKLDGNDVFCADIEPRYAPYEVYSFKVRGEGRKIDTIAVIMLSAVIIALIYRMRRA